MICKYCELIYSSNQSYPLRKATKDLSSDFPRCDWHWRFVCDECGKPCHFNGVSWCETAQKFTCMNCSTRKPRRHKLMKGQFWVWDTYYIIKCPHCDKWHPTLDRQEFDKRHPWQLHPQMVEERRGLSSEKDTNRYKTINHILPEDTVITDESVGKAWDKGADVWFRKYTEFGDVNRQYIINPALFKILGRINEKLILDAGCGNGYLCRLLAKKGARMIGVDVSKKAIDIAMDIEKKTPLNIEYHVGSICKLSMTQDSTFDIVVSNLVLQDLQDIGKAIQELNRVLKPKGKLVFSITHLCFLSPPVHGWVKKPVDSQRKEDWLYWKVDQYFNRAIEEWQYYDAPPVCSFHRTLSDYVKVLVNNGFSIIGMEQPMFKKKFIEENYREFGNEFERIPWFLIISAIK